MRRIIRLNRFHSSHLFAWKCAHIVADDFRWRLARATHCNAEVTMTIFHSIKQWFYCFNDFIMFAHSWFTWLPISISKPLLLFIHLEFRRDSRNRIKFWTEKRYFIVLGIIVGWVSHLTVIFSGFTSALNRNPCNAFSPWRRGLIYAHFQIEIEEVFCGWWKCVYAGSKVFSTSTQRHRKQNYLSSFFWLLKIGWCPAYRFGSVRFGSIRSVHSWIVSFLISFHCFWQWKTDKWVRVCVCVCSSS